MLQHDIKALNRVAVFGSVASLVAVLGVVPLASHRGHLLTPLVGGGQPEMTASVSANGSSGAINRDTMHYPPLLADAGSSRHNRDTMHYPPLLADAGATDHNRDTMHYPPLRLG